MLHLPSSAFASNAWAARNKTSSFFEFAINCRPNGNFGCWAVVAAGIETAGSPARLAGMVITSFRNIVVGSAGTSMENGPVGVVGVNITSTYMMPS